VKLAVSNIAWDSSVDDAAASVLAREGVSGIELAPTKWRADAFEAPAHDVAALRSEWEDRGLPVVAMQSLLFGRPELQLLAEASERQAFLDHLRRVADLASVVGARALVFGSPKNRVRGDRSLDESMTIARDLFRALAPHARERGVIFCIEANPAEYGCDFVVRTPDAADLCRSIDHPSVGVNIDVGGIIINGEDPAESIADAAPFVRHVHASEPQLAALASTATHERTAAALREMSYDGWVSIEMRAAAPTDQLAALERAIRLVKQAYATVPG
jgi:D-psicose/D-tagatose/L-ribulose 3-epimerase